jgi:hypothetical protein
MPDLGEAMQNLEIYHCHQKGTDIKFKPIWDILPSFSACIFAISRL